MKNNGMENALDWHRIRRLLKLGLIASAFVLIGDMLLGWGVTDESLAGMAGFLSGFDGVSTTRLLAAALLGLIGIPVEGLCYFAVYRMIAVKSKKYAHLYRVGILGYLIFGACGLHVPCCALVYFYQQLANTEADAVGLATQFAIYFLVPATILFVLFAVLLVVIQVLAFAKGLTPLPRWCWVFSLAFCLIAAVILGLVGNYSLTNALSTGWLSLGNIWMFGGLIAVSRKRELHKSRQARYS